ncbi:hypothetical protein D3C87_1702560 [compost metagenome]
MGQTARLAELASHFVVADCQGIAGDHLGYHHAGTKTLGELSERPVGDSRHRRQERSVAHQMAPDAQLAGIFRHKLPQK